MSFSRRVPERVRGHISREVPHRGIGGFGPGWIIQQGTFQYDAAGVPVMNFETLHIYGLGRAALPVLVEQGRPPVGNAGTAILDVGISENSKETSDDVLPHIRQTERPTAGNPAGATKKRWTRRQVDLSKLYPHGEIIPLEPQTAGREDQTAHF